MGIFDDVGDFFTDDVGGFFKNDVGGWLGDVTGDVGGFFKDTAGSIWDVASDVLPDIWGGIKDATSGIFNDVLSPLYSFATSSLQGFLSRITSLFKITDNLLDFASNPIVTILLFVGGIAFIVYVTPTILQVAAKY